MEAEGRETVRVLDWSWRLFFLTLCLYFSFIFRVLGKLRFRVGGFGAVLVFGRVG